MPAGRVYLEAKGEGTSEPWRRVGVHKRTGVFYWYGTPYAALLRARGLLAGTVESSRVRDFVRWCDHRRLDHRVKTAESKRQIMVRIARGEQGVTEHPHGSNSGGRVREYQASTTLGGTGWPWCAAFVVWCCLQAGMKLPRAARTASVWEFTEWARAAGRIVDRAPQAGDVVVLFGEGVHIEVVDHSDGNDGAFCDGGNTSTSAQGSRDNGGQVAIGNHRPASEIIHVISMKGL